jgi:hypothetical protein
MRTRKVSSLPLFFREREWPHSAAEQQEVSAGNKRKNARHQDEDDSCHEHVGPERRMEESINAFTEKEMEQDGAPNCQRCSRQPTSEEFGHHGEVKLRGVLKICNASRRQQRSAITIKSAHASTTTKRFLKIKL